MKRTTRHDGIRTIEDLKRRCVVDPDTDCWVWQGATHNRSSRIWLPGIGPVSMNTALPVLMTGERPPKGAIYVPTCGNTNCGNWAHRRLGSRRELMRMLRPVLPESHRQNLAAAKRASIGRYSVAAHVDIMTSTEPARVLGARWGFGIAHVCRVRTGQAWADAEWRTVRKTPPARFEVQLPAGYVSTLNPAECRPWANLAATARAPA